MTDLFDFAAEPEPADLGQAIVPSPRDQEAFAGALLAPEEPTTALRLVASNTEVMPPDFVVPALAEFVPDIRLRTVAEGFAREAMAVDVKTAGGLARADATLVNLRGAIKAVEACFEEATAEANRRHKRLTGMRGEWLEHPVAAVDTVARRIIDEQARIDRLADEERRRQQAEADNAERERLAAAAKTAEKEQAPPAVVEELKQQAKTATAPPVGRAAPAPLKSTTAVKTWKARLAGTLDDAEPNPAIKDLTDAQRLTVLKLLKAIIDGKAPISTIKEFDWAYLNKRAANEGTTLAIPGIEAFEYTAPRGKPGGRR